MIALIVKVLVEGNWGRGTDRGEEACEGPLKRRVCIISPPGLLHFKAARRQAIRHARSRKGYWRMSKTIASGVGLTNAWLAEQGLLSMKTLWASLLIFVERHCISSMPGRPRMLGVVGRAISNGRYPISRRAARGSESLLGVIWWPIGILRPRKFSVVTELDFPLVEVVGLLTNEMFLHCPPCNLAVCAYKQMASVTRMVEHQRVLPLFESLDAAIP